MFGPNSGWSHFGPVMDDPPYSTSYGELTPRRTQFSASVRLRKFPTPRSEALAPKPFPGVIALAPLPSLKDCARDFRPGEQPRLLPSEPLFRRGLCRREADHPPSQSRHVGPMQVYGALFWSCFVHLELVVVSIMAVVGCLLRLLGCRQNTNIATSPGRGVRGNRIATSASSRNAGGSNVRRNSRLDTTCRNLLCGETRK